MNPNSLENLKKNRNMKDGPLRDGQLSHTVRVRITEDVRQKLKGISPQVLGEIISKGLK